MDKSFKDAPVNFSEIERFVVSDKNEIIKTILKSDKCYFYDTCAFRNHAMVNDKEALLRYLKQNSAVVILTRGILMELCSGNGLLWKEHIEYIGDMHQHGIKMVVMYEEYVAEILKVCFCDMGKVNAMLSKAVCYARQKAGSVEYTLRKLPDLRKDILIKYAVQDGSLAERLFNEVRKNKQAGDNLGEELIAICLHMLSNIKSATDYKYRILTDDRKAISILSKAKDNSEQYAGQKSMAIITTAKLCQLMKKEGIFEDEKQVEDIITAGREGNVIKVICSEMYELQANEKKMTMAEFAGKIMRDEVKVYC